ncbi:hypothetical protein LTS18_003795, partial [Coniosporium uncinatum]
SAIGADTLRAADTMLVCAWATMHLSSPTAREVSLKELLSRHADLLMQPNGLIDALAALNVPTAWISMAQALYSRAVLSDRIKEVHFLLSSGEYIQAHDVLIGVVGPKAVVERDLDALREVLGGFMESGREGAKAPYKSVPGWKTGGQVYFDYVHLLDLQKVGLAAAAAKDKDEVRTLLNRIGAALAAMKTAQNKKVGLAKGRKAGMAREDIVQRAGVWEMGRVVAEAVLRTEEAEAERREVLRLPLAEDVVMRVSTELAWGRFGEVMAQN